MREGRAAKLREPQRTAAAAGPGARMSPRVRQVLLGAMLGGVWGLLVWLLSLALGDSAVLLLAVYLVVVCSLIGATVAGVMGIAKDRKRAGRTSVRLPWRRG